MRVLQKKDQDVYEAISIANKMNLGEKVFNSICHSKGLDKKSADYWFYKILLKLKEEGPETLDVLEYCDTTLDLEERHWPVYYLRSLYILFIQESLKEDMTMQYMIPGYRDVEEHLSELDALLTLQKENSVPEFFMTYCLIALIHLEENKVEAAIDYLQKGLEETTASQVNYLAQLFNLLVRKIYYHKKLRGNTILKPLQLRFKEMSLLD